MRRPRGETRVPRLLYIPAVLGLALLVLPLAGLLARANWATLPAAITSDEAVQALLLSLGTAGCATVFCVVLGAPLAILMSRSSARVAGLLRALVTIPLVMPPLVGGIALLYLFGSNGLLGEALYLLGGIRLPFSTAAVVIAQTFVALPFFVITVEGALRSVGTRFERSAAAVGASPWTVVWRITLPLVRPALVAGTVLSFSRALGEFGATALFAGNSPGVTRTMPLAIYTAFNGAGVQTDTAIALSLLLLAVSLTMLVVLRTWRPNTPGSNQEPRGSSLVGHTV